MQQSWPTSRAFCISKMKMPDVLPIAQIQLVLYLYKIEYSLVFLSVNNFKQQARGHLIIQTRYSHLLCSKWLDSYTLSYLAWPVLDLPKLRLMYVHDRDLINNTTDICEAETSMDVPPTSELRATYPDRLWFSDRQEAPNNTEHTWWALSNDMGRSPAFWTPIPPFDMDQAGPLDDSLDPKGDTGSLERRLPSYITIHVQKKCKGVLKKKCNNPVHGTCCTLPPNGLASGHSVYIPSSSAGDIIIPFKVRSCNERVGTPIILGFAGCYTDHGVINSVKTLSCFRC